MAFYHRAVAAQRRRETAGTGAGTRSDLPRRTARQLPGAAAAPAATAAAASRPPTTIRLLTIRIPPPRAPMPPAYNAWYMPPPGTAASAPTDADLGDKPPPLVTNRSPTKSKPAVYASLSRLFSSRSTVDSVLLNVPPGHPRAPDGMVVLHSGRCYGPRVIEQPQLLAFFHRHYRVSFTCKPIWLWDSLTSPGLWALLCNSPAGLTAGLSVVGAAWKSKPEAVYFLNNTIFISLRRWRRFQILFAVPLRMRTRPVGPGLSVSSCLQSFLFSFMSVAVGTKIKQKLTIRRSISAANGPRFSTTDVISNNLYPERWPPPSYNYGGNCDEQPPSYKRSCVHRGLPLNSAMCHRQLQFLIFVLSSLLLAVPLLSQAVDRYGCTHRTGRPAIPTTAPPDFSVELNLVNISYCHAEFHGVGGCTFTCASAAACLNLSKRLSVFSIGPEFGSAPLALVTTDNQTDYRAFATPSNKFYVKLFTRAIVLDVELVKTGACPAGWLYRDGLCYGAAHPNNSRATFTNAAVGCRYVRANLALGFVSSTADVLGLASTTTWPTDPAASITFKGSSTYTCLWRLADCRCVLLLARRFVLSEFICAQMLRYLCSSSRRPGRDAKFYNFEHAGQKPGNRRMPASRSTTTGLLGLAVAAALTGIGFGIRYLWYGRAVANFPRLVPLVAANYAMTADGAAQ
uniref:CUB domain-containing protein n=1 Tax=Macrostomum lignano TaxID=282301 RepID=A0A1I8FUP6_9PLAT